MVLDTRPSADGDTAEAIRCADLCLIVLRPTFFDLKATARMVDMTQAMGKTAWFVLNQAPPRRGDRESPAVLEAIETLRALGLPIAPVGLRRPAPSTSRPWPEGSPPRKPCRAPPQPGRSNSCGTTWGATCSQRARPRGAWWRDRGCNRPTRRWRWGRRALRRRVGPHRSRPPSRLERLQEIFGGGLQGLSGRAPVPWVRVMSPRRRPRISNMPCFQPTPAWWPSSLSSKTRSFIRQSAEWTVEDLGHETLVARDLAEALTHLRTKQPIDALFVDIRLAKSRSADTTSLIKLCSSGLICGCSTPRGRPVPLI